MIEGGGPVTDEERSLMIRETSRIERWKYVSNAAMVVAFFGFLAVSCQAVCA